MREKARIVGGIGVCGRGDDCCQFWNLNENVPVPLDSVRDQGVVINKNEKIFGVHGKIKSCFLHEWDLYRQKRKFLPHMKQAVKIGDRSGRVAALEILNQRVKIAFENGEIESFPIEEVQYENKRETPPENEIEIPKLEIDIDGTQIL